MNESLTCLLCGTTDRQVEHIWVRYLEPVEGEYFGTIYRCKDRPACHRRVQARGEQWIVDDSRTVAA